VTEEEKRGRRPWWAHPLGFLGLVSGIVSGAVVGFFAGALLCDSTGAGSDEFLPCADDALGGGFLGLLVGVLAGLWLWMRLARR